MERICSSETVQLQFSKHSLVLVRLLMRHREITKLVQYISLVSHYGCYVFLYIHQLIAIGAAHLHVRSPRRTLIERLFRPKNYNVLCATTSYGYIPVGTHNTHEHSATSFKPATVRLTV